MLTYILGFLIALTVYQEVTFFLIRRKVKGPIKIMKGAEPFFKKRGKTAALLIHGFTSSPKEFRELGNLLAKNDITVYSPLLAGHGTSPERLSITKYYQWIETVEGALKMLSEEYNNIYLIGNSMGGNLALVSANKFRKVKGVVTLSAPFFFHKEKITKYLILPILKRIKIFQKKIYPIDMTKINKRTVSYDTIPIRSLNQLVKLIEASKKNLENIKVPLLVMQTKNDRVISNESGPYILEKTKSKKKKLIEIPESWHVFIIGEFRKEANKHILRFIKNESFN